MVVQHNLTAMNSNRMLGVTTGSQAKSTEKLSSGYKINRAADDAAGLSISEKMRKQIRGLTQASLNAEDGISAVQTAEGALNEVQDMLQRMNELAVKAANGTMSENDRNYIQDEIKQLETEIDRVAETTKFNETYLLKGDKTADQEYSFAYGVTEDSVSYGATLSATSFGTVTGGTPASAAAGGTNTNNMTVTYTAANDTTNGAAATLTYDGTKWTKGGAEVDLTDYGITIGGGAPVNGTTITISAATLGTYSAFADEDALMAALENGDTIYKGNNTTLAVEGTDYTEVEGGQPISYYDANGNKIAANGLANYVEVDEDGTTLKLKDGAEIYTDEAATTAVTNDDLAEDITATQDLVGALTLKLHVGADATANNQISIDIDAMSAKGLGIEDIKVDGKDDTNALAAIDTIKEAIQKVSTQRSALGAVQNRLEHTIANLDNVVENTTAAESQIRDTDMASEMVKYSNNNILAQAGTSMLAQANQANQNILSLLG